MDLEIFGFLFIRAVLVFQNDSIFNKPIRMVHNKTTK